MTNGIKALDKLLYFYKPTPYHKQRCDMCGIWTQDKAIIIIKNQNKFFKIGNKICLECYYK